MTAPILDDNVPRCRVSRTHAVADTRTSGAVLSAPGRAIGGLDVPFDVLEPDSVRAELRVLGRRLQRYR